MFCSNCGNENQFGSAFCAACGASTGAAVQQQNFSYQEFESGTFGFALAPPPEEVAQAERKSVAALIMGILGIVAALFSLTFSSLLVLGPVAYTILAFIFIPGIVLGSLAIANGRKARVTLNEKNHNFWIALAGVITGSVGLAFSIFSAIFCTFIFAAIMSL
jgi:hypothetical protein